MTTSLFQRWFIESKYKTASCTLNITLEKVLFKGNFSEDGKAVSKFELKAPQGLSG